MEGRGRVFWPVQGIEHTRHAGTDSGNVENMRDKLTRRQRADSSCSPALGTGRGGT